MKSDENDWKKRSLPSVHLRHKPNGDLLLNDEEKPGTKLNEQLKKRDSGLPIPNCR